jgi:transposase-like protein
VTLKNTIQVRDRLNAKLEALCREYDQQSANVVNWRDQARVQRLAKEIERHQKAIERLEDLAGSQSSEAP